MGQGGQTVKVPTGSSHDAVVSYYHYLYSQYYLSPTGGVTWQWLSLHNNLRYILVGASWLSVIALGLWMLTRWQGRSRWRDDLYPQEEYNGYLQEQVGAVGVMRWIFVADVLWAITISIIEIVQGQVY